MYIRQVPASYKHRAQRRKTNRDCVTLEHQRHSTRQYALLWNGPPRTDSLGVSLRRELTPSRGCALNHIFGCALEELWYRFVLQLVALSRYPKLHHAVRPTNRL